jgi:hypothetical protein
MGAFSRFISLSSVAEFSGDSRFPHALTILQKIMQAGIERAKTPSTIIIANSKLWSHDATGVVVSGGRGEGAIGPSAM